MFRVLITAVATLAICVSLSANGADEKAECIGDVVFLMDNTGSMGGMISVSYTHLTLPTSDLV